MFEMKNYLTVTLIFLGLAKLALYMSMTTYVRSRRGQFMAFNDFNPLCWENS